MSTELQGEALDREFKKAVVELSHSLPRTRGVRPYYSEKEAAILKETIDKLVATREPQFVPLANGYKIHTRRIHFSQAGMYLREHLDITSPQYPTGYYNELWGKLKVTHMGTGPEHRRGTLVEFKRLCDLSSIPFPSWQPAFEKYLMTATIGDKFVRCNLPTTREEQAWMVEKMEEAKKDNIEFLYEFEGGKSISVIRLA